MQGDKEVIERLNEILTKELSAINQYFLHARMSKNWGYERIAEKVYKESIEEMKHAQDLIDRILFLEGIPNLQKLETINIGETVPEQLKLDLELELTAIPKLKDSIEFCYQKSDHTSRQLLQNILENEEEHVDWLEAQLGLIKEVGAEHYLAQQIKES